jgi:uncharacterized protein YjiS (DUF1127 family)
MSKRSLVSLAAIRAALLWPAADLARGLVALLRALSHRRDVRALAELDDRALKDIGLVRSDVLGALAEPLHKDPSAVLLLRSVGRRARSRAVALAAQRQHEGSAPSRITPRARAGA